MGNFQSLIVQSSIAKNQGAITIVQDAPKGKASCFRNQITSRAYTTPQMADGSSDLELLLAFDGRVQNMGKVLSAHIKQRPLH